MNRVRLNVPLVLFLPLLLLAALLYPASSRAQYMYLDTNGDGIHTDADVLNPTGTTHVDVWLDTQHDRDGSLQSCNSHTGAPQIWGAPPPNPGLDIFAYDIFLTAVHGTISWGDFEDRMGFEVLPNGNDVASDTQINIVRFEDRAGEEKPAGLYKLGSMSVSVGAGTPSIYFGLMEAGNLTGFGTECSATQEFPNSYVYGIDWFDADGILYGGTINHEPILGQPAPIRVIENRTADQTMTANDEDGQSLLFSKVSGPDYVTVSTTDPGSGQGLGSVRVAPGSADVGAASVVVRASDGIFWCDRTISVEVRREIELNAQPDVSVVAGEVAYNPLYADNPLNQDLQFYMVSGPSFVTIDSRIYGIRTRISPTTQDVGTWTVTLGVTNGTIRDEKSFTVVVTGSAENPPGSGVNHPPVAVTGGPVQGIVGRPVLFDGSRSSDPDGDHLSFSWVFGDGSAGAIGSSAEHRYSADGEYMVDLTVRDSDLFNVGTTVAHILPFAPARAYLPGGIGADLSGASEVLVRVQSVGQSFSADEVTAAKFASFFLSSPVVGEITAIGYDTGGNHDGDRDGIPDRGILFAASDVAKLLGPYAGRVAVDLTVGGDLSGGGRFRAPLTIRVVRHGGVLSASISPNPLNPVGQLSFVTSRPGQVDVRIFDVSGRLARHAIDHGVLPPGYHEVSVGSGDGGRDLPSGVYFYRIETLEGVARGRFAIVR